MTVTDARSVDELLEGEFPLAGEEQQILREWISEWKFDVNQFSERAQALVRGDITRLECDYQGLVDKFIDEGKTLEESKESASAAYATMHETRLRMPAMEVVVAGAQYYVGRRPPTYHQSIQYTEPDHLQCLEFLHSIGVAVDAQD
ncbi:hypothetical protein FBU59_000670, partial [Linderina macrospora]